MSENRLAAIRCVVNCVNNVSRHFGRDLAGGQGGEEMEGLPVALQAGLQFAGADQFQAQLMIRFGSPGNSSTARSSRRRLRSILLRPTTSSPV